MRWTLLAALAMTSPLAAQEVYFSTGDWGTFRFEREAGTTNGMVAGSADSVYGALRTIFKDVGIVIKEENPAGGELLTKRQRVVRQLGKRPVSTYLSCGSGLTGQNADSWYVFVTMGAQVTPNGAQQSQLLMMLTAEAVDVPGGGTERVVCATNGRLELEIIRRLRVMFPATG